MQVNTNENTLIAKIVGLVIALVVVGMVLVPFVTEATTTEKTFHNDGLYNAVELTSESEHTLVFDYTMPNIIVIDDVSIDMSTLNSPYASMTLVFSNDWFVRFVLDTGVILYKCGTATASAIKGATASSEISMELTINEGIATFVYSDSTTYEYDIADDGLIISADKGTYVMKSALVNAYVNSDSIVYGVGRTDRALGTGATSFNAMVKASVEDGVIPIAYSPQYTWNDNRTVNAVENTTYTDLYELSGFTFNLVDNDSVEHAVTYNQIFVPYEVTSELSQHASNIEITLYQMIPILVVLGLIVGIVGLFAYNRYGN